MNIFTQKHRMVRFAEEHSLTEAVFLNCHIKRQENGLYSSSKKQPPYPQSNVKGRTTQSTPSSKIHIYNQFIRMWRNCFPNTYFEKQANCIKTPTKWGGTRTLPLIAYTPDPINKTQKQFILIHDQSEKRASENHIIAKILPFDPGKFDVI